MVIIPHKVIIGLNTSILSQYDKQLQFVAMAVESSILISFNGPLHDVNHGSKETGWCFF